MVLTCVTACASEAFLSGGWIMLGWPTTPLPSYKQWQTLPSPDWVRANGAIVLEGYFSLCDDRVGSSSSRSDLGKNSLVISDMKWGLISSSALCLPHLSLPPKQYHKQTVAIGKTAPSILPLRVPPFSSSSSCIPLKWKVPATIQDPKQDALEPFILNTQISSSSRIHPIPRFYHLLQILPPSLLSNLFSPLQPCCLLKVQTHSPSPGLFHGLLLLFSTPATHSDAAMKMRNVIVSLIFWEPPQCCPTTFRTKDLLLSSEHRVDYNQASAYLFFLLCPVPPNSTACSTRTVPGGVISIYLCSTVPSSWHALFIPVLSADTSISFKTEFKHLLWRKLSWSAPAAEVSVASTQPILHSPSPMFWGRKYLSPEDVALIYKKVLYVLAATLLHKWNILLPFLHSHYTPDIPAATYWTCSLVEGGETEIWILSPLRAMPSLFWLVTAAPSTEPGPY